MNTTTSDGYDPKTTSINNTTSSNTALTTLDTNITHPVYHNAEVHYVDITILIDDRSMMIDTQITTSSSHNATTISTNNTPMTHNVYDNA